MSTIVKRTRSLVVTLLLVAATNLAISRVADGRDTQASKTGVATVPNSPRPKAVVGGTQNTSALKTGVATVPNSPRP